MLKYFARFQTHLSQNTSFWTIFLITFENIEVWTWNFAKITFKAFLMSWTKKIMGRWGTYFLRIFLTSQCIAGFWNSCFISLQVHPYGLWWFKTCSTPNSTHIPNLNKFGQSVKKLWGKNTFLMYFFMSLINMQIRCVSSRYFSKRKFDVCL